MPNPNPHKARRAKKDKRLGVGTINDVKGKVWKAILAAEEVLDNNSAEDALKLRAVHAITQAAASYTKIVETGELEARLEELEQSTNRTGTAPHLKKAS